MRFHAPENPAQEEEHFLTREEYDRQQKKFYGAVILGVIVGHLGIAAIKWWLKHSD